MYLLYGSYIWCICYKEELLSFFDLEKGLSDVGIYCTVVFSNTYICCAAGLFNVLVRQVPGSLVPVGQMTHERDKIKTEVRISSQYL